MLKSENSFIKLGLNFCIVDILKYFKYEKPLPIQMKCIPYLLNGRDVLAMAHTGSGKTIAFILPVLQNIIVKNIYAQSLIIVPTRELAIQIGQVCTNFIKYIQGINTIILYGGQKYDIQLKLLKKKPHIIISTPGRLLDHIRRGTVDISQLNTLIIDEADEMLRMGFIEDIERIIEKIPIKHQTAFFSATLPVDIRKISCKFMNNPKEIYVSSKIDNVCSSIHQSYWLVNGIAKHEALMRFLEIEDFDAAIVFVRTKCATLEISEILERVGYNSAALNGDMDQMIRNKTVSQLRYGQLDVLIATDIAARGLDIQRVSLVVNYDIPKSSDAYIHRIGRTGRAGSVGKSLLFVERQEYRLLNLIKRNISSPILEVQYPTSSNLASRRLIRFANKVVNQLNTKDIDTYRSLLSHIKPELNLTMEDLAAVLLKLAQGNRPLVLPPDPIIKRKLTYKNHHTKNNHLQQQFLHKKNNNFKCIHKLGLKKNNTDIDLYRISVGRNDGVKVRHIIGAISNKGNIYYRDIGNIRLFSSYSIIEVFKKRFINTKTAPMLLHIRILNKSVNMKFLGSISSQDSNNINSFNK